MKQIERHFTGRNALQANARWWEGLCAGLGENFGKLLNWFGVAGFVQPMEIRDTLMGSNISVRVSGYFTVISVDGRDFYFKRLTGEYDGSGMSINRPVA